MRFRQSSIYADFIFILGGKNIIFNIRKKIITKYKIQNTT